MVRKASPAFSKRSLVTVFVLLISLLIPLAHGANGYVLNEIVSTRSGVAYCVHVIEDYAFVTGNDGVKVFDVSDPTSPSRVSTLELADGAFDLCFDGWIAYIAADEEGLTIADFTDPAHPEVLGTLNTGSSAYDVALEGHHAYVADNANGLRVVDVSDPGNPVMVGSHGFSDLRGVEVRGGVAYLAVPNSGLVVLNVSDPSSPSGEWLVSGTYATINLHLGSEYLYISCHSRGTRILDVSDPLDPQIIGSYTIVGGEAWSAFDDGDLLFVADLQMGARLLDIGDPTDPQELASFGTQPHDVFYDGEYAYLACERGLVILQYGPPGTDRGSGTSNLIILVVAAGLIGGALYAYLRYR
ncbi:MAG TPA: hypothetical protein VM050_02615 [Patescibacteria group bacterium]|nr:hypothetical protein [Patescibacteria group bacterium]